MLHVEVSGTSTGFRLDLDDTVECMYVFTQNNNTTFVCMCLLIKFASLHDLLTLNAYMHFIYAIVIQFKI